MNDNVKRALRRAVVGEMWAKVDMAPKTDRTPMVERHVLYTVTWKTRNGVAQTMGELSRVAAERLHEHLDEDPDVTWLEIREYEKITLTMPSKQVILSTKASPVK